MNITVGKLVVSHLPSLVGDKFVEIAEDDDSSAGVMISASDWPNVRAVVDEIFRQEQERRDRCRPA